MAAQGTRPKRIVVRQEDIFDSPVANMATGLTLQMSRPRSIVRQTSVTNPRGSPKVDYGREERVVKVAGTR